MRDVYVVGGDPGRSTGLRMLGPSGEPVKAWQGAGENAGAVLKEWLRSVPVDATVRVAFERYSVGRNSFGRTQTSVVEDVIATARGLARGYGAFFNLQDPSPAKQLASNSFLHRAGLWLTPRDVGQADADDANDATRHAVLALATYHATIFEKLRKVADRNRV